MSAEKPAKPAKTVKPARKSKAAKPRPNSKVAPVRTKAAKARLAQKENFVQVFLPKSLATMTDAEITEWVEGLYKSVVEQLSTPPATESNEGSDGYLIARARRYAQTTAEPEPTNNDCNVSPEESEEASEDPNEYLRNMAREYGMDPDIPGIIEHLRLYL